MKGNIKKLFVHSRTKRKYSEEEFQESYFFDWKNSNYGNYWNLDTDKFWEPVMEKIRKYGMRGKICDIGCAFGFLLDRVRPYFGETYGLDISSFALSQAKNRAPLAGLSKVDINTDELPYPDGLFDTITALHVLHQTDSFEKSLEKIAMKLKKGGYLIVETTVSDTWAGKLFDFFNMDQSLISVPTRKELRQMVKKLGLKIIDEEYALNLPGRRIGWAPVSVLMVLQKE